MAFSVILRRSVSTVAPLTARLVAAQRFSHAAAVVSSILCRGNLSRLPNSWLAPATSFPSRRHFAASSGKKPRVVIEEDEESYVIKVEVPEDFPFIMEDIAGENVITLKREHNCEAITVKVCMPHIVPDSSVPLDVRLATKNNGDKEKSSVPLVVRVATKNGSVLEFTCTAFPDEITIEAVSLRNPEISQDNNAYDPLISRISVKPCKGYSIHTLRSGGSSRALQTSCTRIWSSRTPRNIWNGSTN